MAALLDMQQKKPPEISGCHIVNLREAGLTISAEVARATRNRHRRCRPAHPAESDRDGHTRQGRPGGVLVRQRDAARLDRSPVPLLLVPVRAQT